ncbi:MAG: efflux RND transporter periplasmic adaptor subunit, partial [Rhodanobacter sp.]
VQLYRWGIPGQAVTSNISWVASSAQPRNRANPVKYLALKASVPGDVAQRYGWTPGQRFIGKIILLQVAQSYSVPNMALSHDGKRDNVQVLSGGDVSTRQVKLGVRGATRTQVLEGLRNGDRIVLPVGKAGEAK